MLACLVSIKVTEPTENVYVIEAPGRAWAVHEVDVLESCARCRGVDLESWAVYKNIGSNQSAARSLLSLLATNGELEDPDCIMRFGRCLPLVQVTESSELTLIDQDLSITKPELNSAYRFTEKLLKRVENR